jgi:hypothetical protein
MTPEQINFIVKEVVAVCEAHADDGCFDADGALANSLRIVTSEKFLKLAALSPAKQEQPDFEALAKQYADKIEQNMPKYNREFSAEQVIYYAKKDYLAGLKSGYVAALPYTEENGQAD